MSEIFKRPTITESETIREEEAHGTNFWLGFRKGFERAGGQIIPDPEPTNTEKLKDILYSKGSISGYQATIIAQHLDAHGVTAPTVKGN